MPSPPLTPTPKTYAQLREAVIAVVVEGRRAIDRAWLETYHETGRLINEHVLMFKERADYGAGVYKKLSEDTRIGERALRHCAQFHRCYPKQCGHRIRGQAVTCYKYRQLRISQG